MAEKSRKNEANAQFAKIMRAEDAKKATSEYESTAAALRAKTERLKALRLARDAAALRAAAGRPETKKQEEEHRQLVGLAGRTSQGRPRRLSIRRAGAEFGRKAGHRPK